MILEELIAIRKELERITGMGDLTIQTKGGVTMGEVQEYVDQQMMAQRMETTSAINAVRAEARQTGSKELEAKINRLDRKIEDMPMRFLRRQ